MNYKMLILLITMIMSVIGISGCVDKIYTNDPVFYERGVYFEHPSSWANYKLSGTGDIARFGNGSSVNNSWYGEQIHVCKNKENEWSAEIAISKYKTSKDVNYTVGNIMVDGINATLISYTWNNANGEFFRNTDTDTVVKGKQVIFKKNGYTYTIQYLAAPPESYNEETFNKLINSFKVK